MAETLDRLSKDGVTTVRLSYPDLHGICRGKEFPASFFQHLVDDVGCLRKLREALRPGAVRLRMTGCSGFDLSFRARGLSAKR